ncbi:MAG: L-arabinose isomerase [Spirochaetales bacterium]|nr:L-arabinose isomerase [Spirochaetales bacterium]
MIDLKQYKVWFITGSQHLYGEETLKKVAAHAHNIAEALSLSPLIPVDIIFKPIVTGPEEIYNLCIEANNSPGCIGLITWMHTFSPAKMWIAGLNALSKPFVHLHTQYGREIPWNEIDMDFMNLNQSAHGDREFGFICTRMRRERKVITGHWQDEAILKELADWIRAACAWSDTRRLKIARFGDNMRDVAVTEGDKVEAQLRFGYSVNGFGVGELVEYINNITEIQISTLVQEYEETYSIHSELKNNDHMKKSLVEAARIELGMLYFLETGGFKGFTTTFEDLYGLQQLPGLAVQRLMAKGYGFGAEGDWKTAALVRAMKVMGTGLKGGTSFMEDYTYHLEPGNMKVLGAHMLEVCPSIACEKPGLEVHPLSIGNKADPPRLVFNVPEGPGINASIIDMGNRFRMIVNQVDVVKPDGPLPKLPVARVMWIPRPGLKEAATAWILAGGAHHTGFSMAVNAAHLENFAEMAGIEFLFIGADTNISDFKKELKWNEIYYHLAKGL